MGDYYGDWICIPDWIFHRSFYPQCSGTFKPLNRLRRPWIKHPRSVLVYIENPLTSQMISPDPLSPDKFNCQPQSELRP